MRTTLVHPEKGNYFLPDRNKAARFDKLFELTFAAGHRTPHHQESADLSFLFPQAVYCWGSIIEKKSWPHSLAAPLNSVAGLCVHVLVLAARLNRALSSSCALWLGSVSCSPRESELWAVARLCVQALSSSSPSLGHGPELCGWALCRGLVLLLPSSWPP